MFFPLTTLEVTKTVAGVEERAVVQAREPNQSFLQSPVADPRTQEQLTAVPFQNVKSRFSLSPYFTE